MQKYCFKKEAKEHLMEKEKCRDKADKYIELEFDKCSADKAPYTMGRSQNVKNVTNIL